MNIGRKTDLTLSFHELNNVTESARMKNANLRIRMCLIETKFHSRYSAYSLSTLHHKISKSGGNYSSFFRCFRSPVAIDSMNNGCSHFKPAVECTCPNGSLGTIISLHSLRSNTISIPWEQLGWMLLDEIPFLYSTHDH